MTTKLEDDERNAWQKAGWNPEGDATAKKEVSGPYVIADVTIV